jgi:hypothetical protein
MSQEMNMNEKKTTIKQFNADENQFKDPTYGTFDAKPATTTTITTTTITQPAHSAYHHSDAVLGKDSEVTDQNKPGVMEGAKQMVWQGVEKAKGMFSSNKPVTEQHPGKSYNWKKVTGEQGQTRWVATDDWSNDSARGTFWEKAKGVFTSNRDAKDSEFEQKQEFTADGHEQKGVLQGAKENFGKVSKRRRACSQHQSNSILVKDTLGRRFKENRADSIGLQPMIGVVHLVVSLPLASLVSSKALRKRFGMVLKKPKKCSQQSPQIHMTHILAKATSGRKLKDKRVKRHTGSPKPSRV